MKERPILFKGEMVRAILDGRKTQTRRVCKLPRNYHDIDFRGGGGVGGPNWNDPCCWGYEDGDGTHWALKDDEWSLEIPCPYGAVGDQLWVRETFRIGGSDDCTCYESCRQCIVGKPIYRASYDDGEPWTPSIFMPRSASRIQLEITNVRVERLQDISEEDARWESVGLRLADTWPDPMEMTNAVRKSRREGFRLLWDSINAEKHPWESNPWVWVVEFKRVDQPNNKPEVGEG